MPGKGGASRGRGGGGQGRGWSGGGPGRSASSPGHLKQAAGAQSARDYAPGRLGTSADAGPDDGGTSQRQGLGGLIGRLLGRG